MHAGSLLVVLLLRTAHFNLAKLRDVYLHTNTLAALANLAPHAQGLSSHAAQRLVSLFDMLARRCARGNAALCQGSVLGGPGAGCMSSSEDPSSIGSVLQLQDQDADLPRHV